MYNRVAVIADTHGVLPALEAVLAEPDVQSAEALIVCGDLLAGPQPLEVLQRLQSLGDWAHIVRGNADRELWQVRDGTPSTQPISNWAATQLSDEQLEFLEQLPFSIEREIAGLGRTVFLHATPRDDEEVVLVDSRPQRWRDVLADLDESVRAVVCGHTHMPFMRLVDRRTVVNPGSVGMPYGSTGARWALLGPGVDLRESYFDAASARAQICGDGTNELHRDFAENYIGSQVSDFEALRVFGPLDGRVS
ncbi:metallophosphoesterase family protein [Natronoglycomyces albus]|uniref:Metallophosphoesterase family protein n=1 Tax=Natronoglycomyces albus TaxID=2811108 RepID=A0A895XMP6_9ACTN|nr:metallophosphoesterase family protein [Natronoglycomyces albus]QSB06397.1 metallophosphoesterase family protein [Natronoglycomyces albus]